MGERGSNTKAAYRGGLLFLSTRSLDNGRKQVASGCQIFHFTVEKWDSAARTRELCEGSGDRACRKGAAEG